MAKWIVSAVLIVLLVVSGIIFFNYFWLFGEGVKGGNLIDLRKKGYIFKTYEGEVNLEKFVQASEKTWYFSVEDPRIADSLMKCTGREVSVHYKEYKNPVIWRGMQKYIVDSIISVR